MRKTLIIFLIMLSMLSACEILKLPFQLLEGILTAIPKLLMLSEVPGDIDSNNLIEIASDMTGKEKKEFLDKVSSIKEKDMIDFNSFMNSLKSSKKKYYVVAVPYTKTLKYSSLYFSLRKKFGNVKIIGVQYPLDNKFQNVNSNVFFTCLERD